MNIKIIVCYHKSSSIISNDVFLPIQVGRALNGNQLPIQGDDEGDNISNLNGIFCELTGLYWAWKNFDADYIGLCHYRRFFSFTSLGIRLKDLKNRMSYYCLKVAYLLTRACGNFIYYRFTDNVDSEEELKKNADKFAIELKDYIASHQNKKLFALHPVSMGNLTNYFSFAIAGGRIHMPILDEIVSQNYPEIYPYFRKTLNSNKIYYANMTIMKKDVFDTYCSFLFDVLNKHLKRCLDEKICLSTDEKSISRLSGYFGELLTSTFVLYYSQKNNGAFKKLSMIKYEGA